MATLTHNELVRRLGLPINDKESIYLAPLLELDDSGDSPQIGDSSIDLRLGFEFVTFQQSSFPNLDLFSRNFEKENRKYFTKIKLERGQSITLHPNQLVLGSALEFIKMPLDVSASVLSKSSWGRLGLIIATAPNVDPGYRGCLTLELVNMGVVPLHLYPGLRVAQITFNTIYFPKKLDSEKDVYSSYQGIYVSPTGPQFPVFSRNKKDWDFFSPPER